MNSSVSHLTGVYDADGTLLGELRYLARRALAGEHCSLCDVTHGRLREKRAWRAARRRLPVRFEAVHLDERAPEVAAASEGWTPCVLAHTGAGVELLLGPEELDACGGDPEALVDAILAALARPAAAGG